MVRLAQTGESPATGAGIKKIAKSKPAEHDLPFSAWSLSKLAEFPVAELPYL